MSNVTITFTIAINDNTVLNHRVSYEKHRGKTITQHFLEEKEQAADIIKQLELLKAKEVLSAANW